MHLAANTFSVSRNIMKATVIKNIEGENKIIDIENYPNPLIKNGNDVLIKIVATSVNPIDLQVFSNKNEAKSVNSDILGRELSGIVVEKGPFVAKFDIGDEVYAAVLSMGSNGSFAEFVVANEEIIAHKPRNLTFEQAASIPVSYVTAWQIFRRLQNIQEKSIIILGGTTSVGKALIHILTNNDYHNIFATAGNEESFQQLLKLKVNPEKLLSYRSENFVQNSLASNGSRNFDIVIDCVGNKMSDISGDIITREGIYVDVTNFRTQVSNNKLFRKAANIMNIARYETADLFHKYGEILEEISVFINESNYKPEVMEMGILNSENLQRSFELLEKNLTKSRKIILKNN